MIQAFPQNVITIKGGIIMKTLEKLASIIRKNTEWKEDIHPDDHLVNDLGIDSLDVLLIVGDLEDEFHITIDTDEIKEMKYVKDVVAKLEELMVTRHVN